MADETDPLREALERNTRAFESFESALERHERAFQRMDAAFERSERHHEAVLVRLDRQHESAMARLDRQDELNQRGWRVLLQALEALGRSIEDMREEIHANTQAALLLLDRYGNGPQTA